MTTPTVAADARQRAWRTFLQGLGFTIAAAVVVSLLTAVGSATSWTEFGGVLVGFAFFQAIATSVLAWLMRTVLDGHLTTPPTERGATTAQHAFSVVAILAMLILAAGTATLLR